MPAQISCNFADSGDTCRVQGEPSLSVDVPKGTHLSQNLEHRLVWRIGGLGPQLLFDSFFDRVFQGLVGQAVHMPA